MERLDIIRNHIDDVKNEILDGIVSILEKHNCSSVEVTHLDSTPIIVESFDDSSDTMTLDKIVRLDNQRGLELSCSNSYTNDWFNAKIISVELLFDLYEWLIDYEYEIFDDDN